MPSADSDVAIAAVQAGAGVVRAKYGTSLTRIAKAPMDFATDADIAAEQAILDVLRAARPADAYQGEELGASGPEGAGRSWLIDPLCGTLNFAAHTPLFAVNVALREQGAIRVAATADPLAEEVFWTDGRAAYRRRDGHDSPLSPSATTRLVNLNVDPPFPNADRFRTGQLLVDPDFLGSFHPRIASTTLALAWVAAGRHAAYLSDGQLRDSVHFASGIALCQAAGGVVTGLRGQPLHTGVGGLIAAADEPTHAAILAIVERRFRSSLAD